MTEFLITEEDVSVPSTEELVAHSAEELVTIVVAQHMFFKIVGAELQRRAPNESAACELVAAFLSGQAPPWMTAYLLGCIGAEAGYGTVRKILLSAPRQLAESYAGPALAQIRGERAFDDLRMLLQDAPKQVSREGAAYGLARLASLDAVTAILEAALSARIRHGTAGNILAELPVDAHRVLLLLSSDDQRSLRLATEILWMATSRALRGGKTAPWFREARADLASALPKALTNPALKMMPQKREVLMAFASNAEQTRGGMG